MPTSTDRNELLNNCYCVWTRNYNGTNIAGCIVYKAKSLSDKGQYVTSENSSSSYFLSDSHIFLPAAGYWDEGDYCSGIGTSVYSRVGQYWTSSVSGGSDLGLLISLHQFNLGSASFIRCFGQSVRAVCE